MRIAALSSSVIATGGITRAVQRLDASAARTARDPLDDLAGDSFERIQAGTAVKANVATLRSADKMTGLLLDILI